VISQIYIYGGLKLKFSVRPALRVGLVVIKVPGVSDHKLEILIRVNGCTDVVIIFNKFFNSDIPILSISIQ